MCSGSSAKNGRECLQFSKTVNGESTAGEQILVYARPYKKYHLYVQMGLFAVEAEFKFRYRHEQNNIVNIN